MKIKNSADIEGTDEAIEEFEVLSRLLSNSIEQLTHFVYAVKRSHDEKLLDLQIRYRDLMKEFEKLHID